jgi:ketosteroid isomerase-like protein
MGSRNRLWLIVGGLLILSSCASQPRGGQDPTVLRQTGERWSQHYRDRDLDALMRLYVDDAMVALHNQPALYGKAQIRAYFAERFAQGESQSTFELAYEQIEFHGQVAHIVSKYWLRAQDPSSGAIVSDAGRSLLIYRFEQGQWKIAVDIDQATPDVGWPSPGGLLDR